MPRAGFRVPVLQHVAKIQLFSELAMGLGEKKTGIFRFFGVVPHASGVTTSLTTSCNVTR
jgi:hypothetical protein